MSQASDQITEYLSVGGLFNPEIMNQTQHEAVRDTLIKARDDIQQLERENAALRKENNIELERATHYREQWQKAQAENAALRKMLLDADVVAENERKDGRREWWSGGCWIPTRTMLILVDQPMFDEVQKKGRS